MKRPVGWVQSTLSEVANWGSGGTPSAGNRAYYGGTMPWAVIGDLNDGLVLKTKSSITEAGLMNSSAKLVPAGSVLLAMYGSIGKLGITGREMTTNQAIAFAIPNGVVLPKYLFYYLLSQRRELDAAGKGAAQRNISQTVLKPWPIQFPESHCEQQRIVDILEDHLSSLHAAEKAVRGAERRLVGLEEAWLQRLGRAPESEMTTIGAELLEVRGGWSRSAKHLIGPDEGRPYLKMNNITRRGRLDLVEVAHVFAEPSDLAKYAVQSGDVLFNSKNSGDLIGKTAVADERVAGATFNENIMRLRFRDNVDPAYAALWFLGPVMRRSIRGAASASTNVAAVYKHQLVHMPFWVPPVEHQTSLARQFNDLRESAGRVSTAAQTALARSGSTRRALLAAAFAAKLTGGSADLELTEELASV